MTEMRFACDHDRCYVIDYQAKLTPMASKIQFPEESKIYLFV
jgi:hypothetical protein